MGKIGLSGVGWLVALTGVVACALALRLPCLDQRPMHGDEANQAVRTGILMEAGTYHYDPTDHHGPVLYFAALPFCRMTAETFAETTEWNYRLVPVCFSILTLLLMLGLGRAGDGGLFQNRIGLFCALLFTALSPAMAYYSRFFIQETMLVTFLTGMLVCGRLYAHARSGAEAAQEGVRHSLTGAAWYSIGFGMFAGLAAATKETVVLSFFSMSVAAVAVFGWRRVRAAWNAPHAALAIGSAAVVAVVLFSSFFTYPKGVYEAIVSTVPAYLSRATTVAEHQHPWWFYLKAVFWFKYGRSPVWSEAGLLVPALLAAVEAVWPRRRDAEASRRTRFVRFVLVYTLVLTGVYSAIPYKTPWCMLSFLHGYILLAGVGVGIAVDWLCRQTWPVSRVAGLATVAVLVGGLACRQARMAGRACFTWAADPRNPFVYAHTGRDAMNLVAAVEEAASKAQGYGTLIAVAVPTPDTWPLPWYLRKYKRVGYWTRVEQIPETVKPAIVIVAADQGDVADERFGQGKRSSFYGIRPGVLLNVFVPSP
ncbi:MAG: TIGR03663 family protein [Kiritimatiellae bacterium]|nr:TIGR03663 family protein [Kiritimatiellia bacterium]